MEDSTRRRFRLPSVSVLIVLVAALLGVQALLSILGTLSSFLGRFSQAFLLFVVGAMVAYILLPSIDWVQQWVRRRSAAIGVVFLVLTVGAVVLGFLFFAPFVRQGEDLIKVLRPPPPESTQTLTSLQSTARQTYSSLLVQQDQVAGGSSVPASDVEKTRAQIHGMQQDVAALDHASKSGPSSSPLTGLQQVSIPPSYITPISTWVNALSSTYTEATATKGAVSRPLLDQAVTAARNLVAATTTTVQVVSSTPILVLGLQSRLDARGIGVDLHRQFGNITSELSKQLITILKHLVGLISSIGTLLVNSMLVLIIAFYFLIDGRRLVAGIIGLAPRRQREGTAFFFSSFDHIMGGYIRGHLVLAALSAALAGVGCWLLGVPYVVLISFSTFVLTLIPIIGPVLVYVPPLVIALAFTSMPTPLWLFLYFLVFMQVVTNVIGPRVMSSAVKIHPLEVLAATLIGFPLAGVVGAFFAVPIVGFLHVVVEEAYRQFVKRDEPPPGDSSEPEDEHAAVMAGSPSRPMGR